MSSRGIQHGPIMSEESYEHALSGVVMCLLGREEGGADNSRQLLCFSIATALNSSSWTSSSRTYTHRCVQHQACLPQLPPM